MILDNQRDKFKIPADIAYLNCAYMSPLMNSVVEAMQAGTRFKQQPWTYTSEDFFTYAEKGRSLFAKLIGGTADDVAIVPSASYGIQIAANNLILRPEGEIVLVEDQFPSHVYPWQEKAKHIGGRINIVARPTNGDWTAAVLEAIGSQTDIVAIPATHWADGGYFDLPVIGMAARAAGAKLVLDLTQSLGAMPFDVDAVQPDFMIAAGYKWLMGPYTLGYMYVAPRWQKGEPLEHNWMNRAGSEDFSRLVDYQDDFQKGARRFDMGEKSNPAQLMGSAVALQQLLDWGVENISETLKTRNQDLVTRAQTLGLTMPDEHLRSPHFLGLNFPNGMPAGLPEKLTENNVFVSFRGDSMRVTQHLYNTPEDVDRLVSVLETHG
ncbi:MAG: aminotransferase class V-fold PLP-dependent enzyme [Acidimicrobiales bacterium]|nr:MAG: aminotransferase class V-fold PLP-dependent enzyme [Acidimicrobiales bacterium]